MRSSKFWGVYTGYVFICVLIAIAFSASSTAQEESLFPGQISFVEWTDTNEPCLVNTYSFNVHNIEPVAKLYEIEVDLENPQWALLNTNLFALNPGEIQPVVLYIAPPCEVYGQITGLVKIISDEKRMGLPINLNITRSYDYSVRTGEYIQLRDDQTRFTQVQDGLYTICNAENTTIPIQIQNNVDIGNIIRVNTQGPEWSSLKNPGIILHTQQTGIIDMELQPGLWDLGNHTITIDAVSDRGDIEMSKNISVFVDQCFEVNITTANETLVCTQNVENHQITIENLGEFSEDITLEIDADCAELSTEEITIPQQSRRQVDVVFNTECKKGEEDIEITATLNKHKEITTTQVMKTIITPIAECYSTHLAGPTKIQSYNNETKTITIQNNGIREVAYNLEVEGPEWIALQTKTARIKPQETRDITLSVIPPPHVPEMRYDFTLVAKAKTKLRFHRDFTLVYGDESIIDILRIYWFITTPIALIIFALGATGILLFKQRKRVYAEKMFEETKKGKKYEFINPIKNASLYSIIFNAVKDSAYIWFEKLSLIKLKHENNLHVYEWGHVKSLDAKNITLRFKIEKKWIEKNKCKHNDVVLRVYNAEAKKWKQIGLVKTKADQKYVHYATKISKEITFAIGVEKKKGEEAKASLPKTQKKSSERHIQYKELIEEKLPMQTAKWTEMQKLGIVICLIIVITSFGTALLSGIILYCVPGIIGLIAAALFYFKSKKRSHQAEIMQQIIDLEKKIEQKKASNKSKIEAEKKVEELSVELEKIDPSIAAVHHQVSKEQPKPKTKRTDMLGIALLCIILFTIIGGVISGYLYYVLAGIGGISLLIGILFAFDKKRYGILAILIIILIASAWVGTQSVMLQMESTTNGTVEDTNITAGANPSVVQNTQAPKVASPASSVRASQDAESSAPKTTQVQKETDQKTEAEESSKTIEKTPINYDMYVGALLLVLIILIFLVLTSKPKTKEAALKEIRQEIIKNREKSKIVQEKIQANKEIEEKLEKKSKKEKAAARKEAQKTSESKNNSYFKYISIGGIILLILLIGLIGFNIQQSSQINEDGQANTTRNITQEQLDFLKGVLKDAVSDATVTPKAAISKTDILIGIVIVLALIVSVYNIIPKNIIPKSKGKKEIEEKKTSQKKSKKKVEALRKSASKKSKRAKR